MDTSYETSFQIHQKSGRACLDDLTAWNRMLLKSESTTSIYQTPNFFRYLCETAENIDDVICFYVHYKNIEDESDPISIIPCCITRLEIPISPRGFFIRSPSVQVLNILGNIPFGSDASDNILNWLTAILRMTPKVDALYFPALPRKHSLSVAILKKPLPNNIYTKTIFGWRDCHTIPLPLTFDEYEQQFGSKKRYNIKRQIRLLDEHCHGTKLQRINNIDDVENLTSALNTFKKFNGKKSFLPIDKYTALARNNLLLCYILSDRENKPRAAIIGTQACQTYYIHDIIFDHELLRFSPGTSILHLALNDAIGNLHLRKVDLGYGSPAISMNSSNVIEQRCRLLILRKSTRSTVIFTTHYLLEKISSLFKSYASKYKQLF